MADPGVAALFYPRVLQLRADEVAHRDRARVEAPADVAHLAQALNQRAVVEAVFARLRQRRGRERLAVGAHDGFRRVHEAPRRRAVVQELVNELAEALVLGRAAGLRRIRGPGAPLGRRGRGLRALLGRRRRLGRAPGLAVAAVARHVGAGAEWFFLQYLIVRFPIGIGDFELGIALRLYFT